MTDHNSGDDTVSSTQPTAETKRPTLQELAARAAEHSGMCCPKCGCADLRSDGAYRLFAETMRYRVCRHCGHKVLTCEKIVRDVALRKKS